MDARETEGSDLSIIGRERVKKKEICDEEREGERLGGSREKIHRCE